MRGQGLAAHVSLKDLRALIKTARDHDVSLRILEAVDTVNDTRKRAMGRKVSTMFSGALRGKTVAILGLTFKPNTDDMREAPSLAIISALQDMGAQVRADDSAGMRQAQELLKDVTYCESAYECAEAANAPVIAAATEWEDFVRFTLAALALPDPRPVVVDLRNIYRPSRICIIMVLPMPVLASPRWHLVSLPDALLDQLSPIERIRTSAPGL